MGRRSLFCNQPDIESQTTKASFQNNASRPLIGWCSQGRSRRRLIGGKRHLINLNSKTLLSDDLKSSIPNLSTLENEFGIETGTWKLASNCPFSYVEKCFQVQFLF